MINKQRLVDGFIKLVNINSPSLQEKEISTYLARQLVRLGFQVEEDNVGKKINGQSGNIIGRKKGTIENSQEARLFCAHMDTVTSTHNINIIEDKGKIQTNRTTILGADDKAGIAAIIEVLECIHEKEIPHHHLEIVFTVAEEIGLLGAKYLDYSKMKAKTAFIIDSGGPIGTIVVQAPSQADIKVKIKGKSAHAGVSPEEGINAICIAADAITQLKIGRVDEETTNNIGMIKGGRATNVVPDQVELRGEVRSMNKDTLEQQLDVIKHIMQKTVDKWGGGLEMESEIGFIGFHLEKNNRAVQLAVQSIEKSQLQPQFISRGGGSDTNVFNLYGFDAVNLGMGSYREHTTEEYINVDDLEKCATVVFNLMVR